MAKLLLINSETFRAGINEIGDVVDIKPDTYKPGPAESFGFEIVTIPGTVEDYAAEQKKKVAALKPADMTEKEDMIWHSSMKFEMRVSNKQALSMADALSCKLPDTKPIIEAVEK